MKADRNEACLTGSAFIFLVDFVPGDRQNSTMKLKFAGSQTKRAINIYYIMTH